MESGDTEDDKSVDPRRTSSFSDLPEPEGITSARQESPRGASGDQVLSTLPSSLPGYLPWEDDMEMVSKYLDRKGELEQSHHRYLTENPELKAILADFLQAVLIQKPDNIYSFAQQFFRPFGPKATREPSFPSFKPGTN